MGLGLGLGLGCGCGFGGGLGFGLGLLTPRRMSNGQLAAAAPATTLAPVAAVEPALRAARRRAELGVIVVDGVRASARHAVLLDLRLVRVRVSYPYP